MALCVRLLYVRAFFSALALVCYVRVGAGQNADAPRDARRRGRYRASDGQVQRAHTSGAKKKPLDHCQGFSLFLGPIEIDASRG